MAKNHVLLIHGIGQHAKGWSARWQSCVRENAQLFAPYDDDPAGFDADVAFAEITYDHVFEQGFRQRWQNLAGALDDASVPAPVRTVLSELSQSPDARLPAFVWTHSLDFILWYSFAQARQAVIAEVGLQIAEALRKAQREEADVHILAHSLGTSVAHDTLLCLAASPDTQNAFDPKHGGYRWASYVSVANVSRVMGALQSPSDDLDADAFRPHSSRVQGKDLVATFVNVRHQLDPFTFPRRFKPEWPSPPYWPIEVDRFDEPGLIHDLETQFDNPLAARTCLRLFTGRKGLGSKAEMDVAWRRYDQKYGRSGGDLFASMRRLLEPDADRLLGPGEFARFIVTYAKEMLA
ncbi:MAG TPA: hypothetical protein VF384_10975 [Planctomycetota bacterium]